MKAIEVTCGYREELDNGEIRYHGSTTDNGICYKNMDAFNKGEGVIYIGEYSLIDLKENGDGQLWTREILINEVREILEREYPKKMSGNEKFMEFLAKNVLATCNWQELSTYLYELTYSYSVEELFEDSKLWDK